MSKDDGSITVEMSALSLCILWVTFLIIMTAFYMFDVHRLHALAEKYVYYSLYNEEEMSGESFINGLDSSLIYIDDVECRVRSDEEYAAMSYTARWRCPLQRWLFLNDGFDISDRIKISLVKPEKLLRFVNGIMKGLGG